LITRRALGFHTPDALIALAMLSLADLCPPLPRSITHSPDPRKRQERAKNVVSSCCGEVVLVEESAESVASLDRCEALAADGMRVLVQRNANKREGPRPGWDGGLYAFMRRVLAMPAGAALYRRRQGRIEPVFADTKFNRKIDRFLRRGRAACRSEWRPITATHNLRKLHQHHVATAVAT
jgi:hypothetical protein